MRRTLALTIFLALTSLGISAYAQTAPADHGSTHTQTGKKHKKTKENKEKKQEAHAPSHK